MLYEDEVRDRDREETVELTVEEKRGEREDDRSEGLEI